MNSIRRFAGRIGSALALFGLLTLTVARADNAAYVYANHPINFTHLVRTGGTTAVGVNDPAFRDLLASLGATLTWHPGERYVLVSTPQPLVLNFSIGDRRYDMGLLSAQASIPPFVQGQEAYLPLDDLLRALSLSPVRDGNDMVLQPLLTSVDVQGSANAALIVAHAATPLHPKISNQGSDRVVYTFEGVASSIDGVRSVDAGGVRTVQIVTSGTARAPQVTLTLSLYRGAHHDAPVSHNGDFEVAFGDTQVLPSAQPIAVQPPAQQQPVQQPQQAPSATVNAVVVQASGGGSNVNVTITGNANYEWHRLREPDNRFWIDIKGATLAGGPRDETEADPLISLRVRQNDPQTVRIALSLTAAKNLTVSPSATGLTIAIAPEEVADAQRFGSGSVGTVVSANDPQPLVTPVPPDMYGQGPDDWKFGGTYVPTNPKLIIIDPGHGGSDPGAQRNGTTEASLALDMAKRLQTILVARGWQVQLTRTSDADVFAPNDSAREELQARVDIANSAGARMLISIHANSFINSGPHGTTTYYSKMSDVPLARDIEQMLAATLGTKDDGMIKSKLYITLHSNMPAALVETAFLSNPDDYQRLVSPEWRQKVAQGIADGIDRYAAANPIGGSAAQ